VPKKSEVGSPKEIYLEAWYAARDAPIGISVIAHPRDAVYTRLLEIRRSMGVPELLEFDVIKPAHAENELWIVRKKK